MSESAKPTARGRGKAPVWAWALPAVAILAFGGVRYQYVSFKSPSGSMIPTLLVGDRFFVERGFHAPPRRGEVVVFRFPEHREQDFVKRIVAAPGDTLEMIGNRPILNGWLVPHCHVGSYPADGRTQELYVEYLGDAVYGTLLDEKAEERACKSDAECGAERCRAGICGTVSGPFKVASGEVWVLGDNRPNSHDSRQWRGGLGAGLPLDDIRGTARTVWMGEGQGRSGTSVQGPPVLPPAAGGLQPALERCLRERPAQTTPPAP